MKQNKRSGQLSPYGDILVASVVVGFFIFAFFPVWQSLINAWMQSEDYSHAFLILPISMYLAWEKKEQLAQILVSPSWYGLLLVFCSSILFLFAFFAGITTLSSLALVLSIIGIVIGLTGWKITKVLLFPLLFLLLMIPIPSQIYYAATTPLQLLVSQISVSLASLIDVPIYREGNVIHLPNRTLQVVAACSGMRSMIALSTLSLVYGYISLRSNSLRALLVLSALPVAILINIVRVMAMILAFYYYDYNLTDGSPHTYLGLFVFILAMLLIVSIQKIMSRLER